VLLLVFIKKESVQLQQILKPCIDTVGAKVMELQYLREAHGFFEYVAKQVWLISLETTNFRIVIKPV